MDNEAWKRSLFLSNVKSLRKFSSATLIFLGSSQWFGKMFKWWDSFLWHQLDTACMQCRVICVYWCLLHWHRETVRRSQKLFWRRWHGYKKEFTPIPKTGQDVSISVFALFTSGAVDNFYCFQLSDCSRTMGIQRCTGLLWYWDLFTNNLQID